MSTPQNSVDFRERTADTDSSDSPSQTSADDTEARITAFIKNRFQRLYNVTQPRKAIERARREFEARRLAAIELQKHR